MRTQEDETLAEVARAALPAAVANVRAHRPGLENLTREQFLDAVRVLLASQRTPDELEVDACGRASSEHVAGIAGARDMLMLFADLQQAETADGTRVFAAVLAIDSFVSLDRLEEWQRACHERFDALVGCGR